MLQELFLPNYLQDMLIMNSIIRLYNINSIGDLGLGWYDNSSRCKSYAAHWLAHRPVQRKYSTLLCSAQLDALFHTVPRTLPSAAGV